jgi:hypothetical protein
MRVGMGEAASVTRLKSVRDFNPVSSGIAALNEGEMG